MNTALATKKEDNPSVLCAAAEMMRPAQEITGDVFAGTLRLREKRDVYLPKFEAERDAAYRMRCGQATLHNVFKRTVKGYTGLVFREDPTLEDDNAPEIAKLWENIDNAGTHGAVFLKEAFECAVRDGHCAILCEFPQNTAKNRAEEMALDLRPYWTLRTAAQILNWRTVQEAGRTVLQQITFREETTEAEGDFLETQVIRYRVYTRGLTEGGAVGVSVQLWKEKKDGERVKIVPETEPQVITASGNTPLDEIPVAVIYGAKKGVLCSEPPLLDLALINIRHFQDYSDYRTGKQKAALIVPYAVNRKAEVEGQEVIALGFDSFIDVGESGNFGFAEPNGNALAEHRIGLSDTEKQMAWLGLSALMPVADNTASKSIQESTMDNAASTSELATMARNLQDGAELALGFLAKYLGIEKGGGSLELGVAWQDLMLTVDQARVLHEMQGAGALSLKTLWGVLQRAHWLGDDFDAEKEREELAGVDVIPPENQ